MIQNIKTKNRGFTIVELLIVIVVIAILAAITIVAYNGIQTRANVSTTQGNATIIQKKLEAYNSVVGTYPVAGTATTLLNGQIESNLGNSVTIGTPTANNGKSTFQVKFCTAPAGATGYQLFYWDYTTSTLPTTPQITGGTSTVGCGTWSANAV